VNKWASFAITAIWIVTGFILYNHYEFYVVVGAAVSTIAIAYFEQKNQGEVSDEDKETD
jgi:hypothetical protein